MKRLVVQADPWHIFFVFAGAMLICGLVPDDSDVPRFMASVLLATVIFGWFWIVGTSLNENLPEEEQRSDTLFIISCFYCALLVILAAIPGDFLIVNVAAYAVILLVPFVFGFFYMIYFVSVLFTSNQDRFSDKHKLSAEAIFVLFIVFIFGVLMLQSRIKRFFS